MILMAHECYSSTVCPSASCPSAFMSIFVLYSAILSISCPLAYSITIISLIRHLTVTICKLIVVNVAIPLGAGSTSHSCYIWMFSHKVVKWWFLPLLVVNTVYHYFICVGPYILPQVYVHCIPSHELFLTNNIRPGLNRPVKHVSYPYISSSSIIMLFSCFFFELEIVNISPSIYSRLLNLLECPHLYTIDLLSILYGQVTCPYVGTTLFCVYAKRKAPLILFSSQYVILL